MKRKHIIGVASLLCLLAICITGAFTIAHADPTPTPPLYVCVDATGKLDTGAPMTTDSTATCPTGETSLALGAKGDTGAPGKDGTNGLPGATGPQGISGPIGPQGIPGVDGSPGPKGDTGNTGPQGISGPIGPQGVPGLSHWVIVRTGYFSVAPGVIEVAHCPTGDVVVGGGVDLGHLNWPSSVSLSRPDYDLHGWDAAYEGKTTNFRVWAVCAAVA